MLKQSLVVKIVAKPARAEEDSDFLTSALALAQAEDFTPVWFALRADETTFYIVDAFESDAARQQHLEGAIAAKLMARADELLAEAPQIQPASVLASKLVA